ncbi:MAG TPA: hypothetical protein VGX23_29895 [Actinocrinis sp.]|nr:hypothetical protein [Actinocrinis sp.]
MAASNKDLRDLIAARRERRSPRVGVPQDDPADVATTQTEQPTVVEEVIAQPPAELSHEDQTVKSDPVEERDLPVQPMTVIQDPRLLAVDTTVSMAAFSSYMYPDRRRQLKQEATSTGNSMQEIIDLALSEYFEKRYGKQDRRK